MPAAVQKHHGFKELMYSFYNPRSSWYVKQYAITVFQIKKQKALWNH